ncbi:MAG: precorrin-6y C5,15-methyltransferase (decarboxylating) subunit CbiE [Ruminococcus sp.]|nr:precorrin-6y C5,15-methyltransferase (decarboxylating) subunit CbiE [Ruminococcus sp.]
MKIYIIGVGMDADETLTKKAKKIIGTADVLIGSHRIAKIFEHLHKPFFTSWKGDEIRSFIDKNDFETAAVLVSGDSGFFSGAELISEALSRYETEIVCGISSPVYFCSKIKKPWQDMKFISLHGADSNVVRNIRKNKFCFFLLGGNAVPADICRKMCEYGAGDVKVYIGENLSLEKEKISVGKAREFTDTECAALCVMITENDGFEKGVSCGIPDSEFIRGNVPMTKSEVRCVVISKLGIGAKDICWDIGCGTGSVSAEMALQCFDGTVYSADKNAAAAELTRRNKLKFGCDNIREICANAPECLKDFPPPDKVFIGGGGENISGIIAEAYGKNREADIVITAVSLETLERSVNAFKKFGIAAETVQISVTRTKKSGEHTMLAAENPVFIIKGAGH